MPDASCLFVSGMGRSGTTLLDKLLCNHSQLSVLSQPFPYLFLKAKRDFLKSIGEPDAAQPLSHYFLDNRYQPDDLQRFLESYGLTAEDVRGLFAEMADYDGQYHKPPDLAERLQAASGGAFLETYRQLAWILRHRESAAWYGAKETHCEEFFPFFAQHGVKCLAIVRDPRDVIASFHYGTGQRYGGRRRPTLFYIRNWRKSVMFLLLLENHPDFHWLRYEDLVSRPEVTLRKITDFLGIDGFPTDFRQDSLLQQDGRPWNGNSSYASSNVMNEQSVGRYRDWLPSSMRRYIECCCLAELRLLEYAETETDSATAEDTNRAWEDFQEPFPIERTDFAADYSVSQQHVRQEQRRLLLLREPERDDPEGYFLNSRIRERLSRALAGLA
ncbi:MAG: sulfotransferase [Pirellulaceae bacterium]|nr:sulfotransferase [Pirellulaceae bacterium]